LGGCDKAMSAPFDNEIDLVDLILIQLTPRLNTRKIKHRVAKNGGVWT
jgi:hypothetical protein